MEPNHQWMYFWKADQEISYIFITIVTSYLGITHDYPSFVCRWYVSILLTSLPSCAGKEELTQAEVAGQSEGHSPDPSFPVVHAGVWLVRERSLANLQVILWFWETVTYVVLNSLLPVTLLSVTSLSEYLQGDRPSISDRMLLSLAIHWSVDTAYNKGKFYAMDS